jgi:hypothetical protein
MRFLNKDETEPMSLMTSGDNLLSVPSKSKDEHSKSNKRILISKQKSHGTPKMIYS